MILMPTPALWLDIDGRLYVLRYGYINYYQHTGVTAELGSYESQGPVTQEKEMTMTIDEARQLVLADVRESYGPDEMTDDEAIAHVYHVIDPQHLDPMQVGPGAPFSPVENSTYDAYAMVLPKFKRVRDLEDGELFHWDGAWHTCAVVLFGAVAVYATDKRGPSAPTIRLDIDRDDAVLTG
jgi:hypothetical protein